MKKYGRKDSTHNEIAKVAIALGFSVIDLSALGSNIPDMLVSRGSMSFLIECKSDRGKLSLGQLQFSQEWRGMDILLLRTKKDAINALTNNFLPYLIGYKNG